MPYSWKPKWVVFAKCDKSIFVIAGLFWCEWCALGVISPVSARTYILPDPSLREVVQVLKEGNDQGKNAITMRDPLYDPEVIKKVEQQKLEREAQERQRIAEQDEFSVHAFNTLKIKGRVRTPAIQFKSDRIKEVPKATLENSRTIEDTLKEIENLD